MKSTHSTIRTAALGLALAGIIGWGLAPSAAYSSPSAKTSTPTTAGHTHNMHSGTKAKMSGPFDGKQFEGTCGIEGKTDGSKEEVSFRVLSVPRIQAVAVYR